MDEQNLEQDPKSQAVEPENHYKTLIYVTLAIFATALIVGLASYYFFNKGDTQVAKDSPNLGGQTILENQESSKSLREVYFGKGSKGKYSLVNVSSGESKQFIPGGYEILDQYSYQKFPTYLILRNDDSVYSYSVENGTINNVFSSGQKVSKNQDVRVYPSITEKDKFIIKVNSLDFSEVSEFDGSSPITSSEDYTFDASLNKTQRIVLGEILTCKQYDSKNQRFFSWACGEGIGSATPLTILDMEGKKVRDVISSGDFGLLGDDIAEVKYTDGHFFAIDNENGFKIIVIDASLAKPIKEVYTLDNTVTLKPGEISTYSLAIDRSTNTIVLGSGSYILVLPFDVNKKIVKAVYIPDAEIYANFIFVNESSLYYLAKNIIRTVNLKTLKLEKSITTPESYGEISLFSL